MGNTKSVKSIIRSANILKCISKGCNRIRDIAKSSNLSKGTTHRLLITLAETGFVVQDPISLKYYLGPAILELSSNSDIAHNSLIICALEQMQDLMMLTGETVLLHVRIGLQRVCIAEVESLQNIKYTNGIGYVAPLYTGAAGKVLLSELQDDQLDNLLAQMRLAPITPNTIIDKDRLLDEIHQVREVGYSTSLGERVLGSSCVSLPIKNYIMPVALSILGPDNRFTPIRLLEHLGGIKESSKEISNKLKNVRHDTERESM